MAKQSSGAGAAHVTRVVYALNQRRTQVYITFLQYKIAELEKRIESHQSGAAKEA